MNRSSIFMTPLTFFSTLCSSAKSDVDNGNIFILMSIVRAQMHFNLFVTYYHVFILRYIRKFIGTTSFLAFLFRCSHIFMHYIRIVSLFIFIVIRSSHSISVLLHLALLFSIIFPYFFNSQALTFKVPFDIAQLWAVRSSDPSDLLTIFTQTGMQVRCLFENCFNQKMQQVVMHRVF